MAYSVFFNGVFYSKHERKGAALDAAYRHVNHAQSVYAVSGAKGSKDCAEKAERLSKLMGALASTIPEASRSRCSGRYVFDIAEAGHRICVRRDATK